MRRPTVLTLIASLIAGSMLLAGPATAATSKKLTTLTFTTTLTSSGTTLQNLPGGHTYGWNNLSGTSTWGNQAATISFLGDVDYVNGSGPFNGYVTVTRADGVVLGTHIDGNALAVPEGSAGTRTLFAGSVSVIQGTGAFRGASGIGTMTGVRKSALGSPVEMTLTLSVLRK